MVILIDKYAKGAVMRNILISISIALLTACGGGGGGGAGTSTPVTHSGQFVDAPTKGLIYTASPSGLAGTTDASGNFTFRTNDTVSFKIVTSNGDVPLGEDGQQMEVDYGDYGDRAVRDYDDYGTTGVMDDGEGYGN